MVPERGLEDKLLDKVHQVILGKLPSQINWVLD